MATDIFNTQNINVRRRTLYCELSTIRFRSVDESACLSPDIYILSVENICSHTKSKPLAGGMDRSSEDSLELWTLETKTIGRGDVPEHEGSVAAVTAC